MDFFDVDHIETLTRESSFLQKHHFCTLQCSLPERFQQRKLHLIYSTLKHGISLNTFYQKLHGHNPVFVVVQDENHEIFGAFTTETWAIHPRYFGTGESYLFTFHPNFKAYTWSKANNYFMLAKHDFIALGGGGEYGLWLDSDFENGSSGPSATFGNPCLTRKNQFKVLNVEVYGLH